MKDEIRADYSPHSRCRSILVRKVRTMKRTRIVRRIITIAPLLFLGRLFRHDQKFGSYCSPYSLVVDTMSVEVKPIPVSVALMTEPQTTCHAFMPNSSNILSRKGVRYLSVRVTNSKIGTGWKGCRQKRYTHPQTNAAPKIRFLMRRSEFITGSSRTRDPRLFTLVVKTILQQSPYAVSRVTVRGNPLQ